MASLSPSWVSQSTFHVTASRVGHGKISSNCFHCSSCFDNREIIAVSIAMNVTARSLRVTQRKDFSVMLFMLHKSTPVAKESVHVCIETTAQSCLHAGFTCH